MKECSKDHFCPDGCWLEDPYLQPYRKTILRRLEMARAYCGNVLNAEPLATRYHEYFGLHWKKDGWVFREWAPHAKEIFILTHENGWKKSQGFRLSGPDREGVFRRTFPCSSFSHGLLYRLRVVWEGGEGDRIPTAATYVVQDPYSLIFNAQVWHPEIPYLWQTQKFCPPAAPLLVYEAHVGMALEEGRIGTFREFADHILPKVVTAGYNTLQLMAVQEHPYYGSFGYHVSSFFAPSSRFGSPDDFKYLVDRAHGEGLRVIVDMVHSHGVKNEVEGLSRFDGRYDQFFHDGDRGMHTLWDSRCFNYGNIRVAGFLLSTLRYFLEEFRVDGFRFDGITSMLFEGHGLGRAFISYEDYFGPDVDEDALSYLYTANVMVHGLRRDALTLAEDVSGFPGLAAPLEKCGTGFDYRFSMGIADHFLRLLKEVRDEDWRLDTLWFELTRHRSEEHTVSYVECHDQALVGDKTVMMHLLGAGIYDGMALSCRSVETLRAVALHKMIRLLTLATAGSGYLNFMGNEFGHPEWIDFPSERNGYSFHYARRQWSLTYDDALYYKGLAAFDRAMIRLVREYALLDERPTLLYLHEDDKIIAFRRNRLVLIFNIHPDRSLTGYPVDAPPGKYRMVLDTDDPLFCGPGRLTADQVHFTMPEGSQRACLHLYLPSRCAMVLAEVEA